MDTGTLVDRPTDRTILPVKWVFRRKLGPKGEVLNYKARLVVRGDRQQEGLDYAETFSPVANIAAIKLLLTKP